MGTERTFSRLLLASALAGLLGACGSSDPKSTANDKIYVNELQPSNQDTYPDEGGAFADWVELYNAGSEAVNLEGYYASDSLTNSMKHKLPAGLSVPAGGFLILWADGDTTQIAAHLSFKLSASGEAFLIADPDGAVLDSTSYSAVATQASWARHPDGTGPFAWCDVPTPLASNGAACTAP
jgi:hypothetical protein